MAIKVSAIICSYNRCESLAKTLESLAASTFSKSWEWEILVVDNNSNDQTSDVAQKFCQRYPDRFRYLFEPRQGKSHALNAGIAAARGEFLAFTDDDVIVEPTWLQNVTAAMDGKGFSGVGGCILPEKAVVLPPWLTLEGPHSMSGLLVLLDRGPVGFDCPHAPFGANMAFRKEMFEKYGGFRTDLGPPPKLRGEDTEFCFRLLRAGELLWYEPSAIVYHEIPASRLTKKYFLGWWYGNGRTTMRLREKRPPVWGISSYYLGIGHRMLRTLPAITKRWIRESHPQDRFFYRCQAWMTLGETMELFYQSLAAKKPVRTFNSEPSGSTTDIR